MRNLKRALSLALASVMLLGMMVVGTSAASANSFTDADEISNKEAVAIATGLGIFDGYTDGSFGPDKVVTRAEMAVVIAKILHGADVDPSNFAGAGKFTDVPAWAEGYVNLVASLGIIEGYGDGKFGPNDTVTTVQATTMLLKALGYFVDNETALGTDWQLTVTSKATALGLYGDKTLAMNAGLTRENVAELTFNALFAQRVAYDDYRGLYVKANDRNVVVTNGTEDALNTLADNTFGLYAVEGTVIANGMTDEALSETLKSDAQTRVEFAEDIDLDQDGKAEYGEDDYYDFEVETGLDMIGHAAKVYYKIVKKAPVVFAIVDQATKVEYVSYSSNTTTLANRANDAGFKKNSILDITTDNYIVNYDVDTKNTGLDAVALDTLLVISNSSNYEVDCVIALDQYLDKVVAVDEIKGEIEYTLADAEYKTAIATEAADEGDFVITTNIGNNNEIVVFEQANLVAANITKITGVSDGNATVKKVTADGEDYTKSPVANTVKDEFVVFNEIATIGETTLVLDQFGKLIGLATEKELPNYAYVAQYGIRHSTGALNTKDVLTAHVYFADGTNGIYEVDVAKSETMFDIADDGEISSVGTLNNRNWGMNAAAGRLNEGDTTANGLGIWNVKVLANGKISINSLVQADNDTQYISYATVDEVTMVPGHSTLLKDNTTLAKTNNVSGQWWGDVNDDKIVDAKDDITLYNNNDTIYFYVNGTYGDDLTVKVITGIKNVIKVVNDTDLTVDLNDDKQADAGKGINQAFATLDGTRGVIDTMLIENVRAGAASDVYYYDQGNYYVVEAEAGKYTVTYKLYDDATGELVEVTYDNGGKYFDDEQDAKDHAKNFVDGFYVAGLDNLEHKVANVTGYYTDRVSYTFDGVTVYGVHKYLADNEMTYVVNAAAEYDEYVDNLFDNVTGIGSITETTKVVDLCNSGLDTVRKIERALDDKSTDKGDVQISYSFDEDYKTTVLFVTAYDPDGTDAPNASVTNADVTAAALTAKGSVTLTLKAAPDATDRYDVTLQVFSVENGGWVNVVTETLKGNDLYKNGTEYCNDYTFQQYMEAGEVYRVIAEGEVSTGVKA